MGQLEGKTAVITGGGTGIGKAIAKRYHAEGAFVIINGRREHVLKEAEPDIAPGGDRILSVSGDMTVDDDIAKLVDAAVRETGSLDVFVNNAGVMRFHTLADTPVEEWDLMMKVNVYAPWRTMIHVAPVMKRQGGGSIINISSIAGIKAFPNVGAYCASKAAMQVISQTMALEAADDHIRVNCILPALVEDTELAMPIFGSEEKVEEFWARMRSIHPLGRNGKPEDIANAAVFFASDQTDWVTGVLFSVDGGRHMASNRPAD